MLERKSDFTDLAFSYKEMIETGPKNKKVIEEVTHTIKFTKFITLYALQIPIYSKIICKPNTLENNDTSSFNIWQGYVAEKINNIDMSKVNPMLEFIKEVIFSNNEIYYKYIMSWLYILLAKPELKTNVVLFLYTEEFGTGKNTFTDFLSLLLGSHLYSEISGIDKLVDRYNKFLLGKKLIVVDETSSVKKEFVATYDKIKSLVTGNTVYLEEKFEKAFSVENLLNIIIVSNHSDSIHVSKGDRRYLCLELSKIHLQDIPYFTKLREICFNTEGVNNFYTYILSMDINDIVDVRIIPETELKKQIVEISMSSSLKYLKYLKNTLNSEEVEELSASTLYFNYKNWCQINNENLVSNTKFGLNIKNYITKEKKANGAFYLLNTIKPI